MYFYLDGFILISSLNVEHDLIFFRFKFDDERVTKEDMKRALEEQYGGEEEVIVFSFNLAFSIYFCMIF